MCSFVKGGKGDEGKGKGKFDGCCNHCGLWGHRFVDCWKKTQEVDRVRAEKGKGGEKGGKGFGGTATAAGASRVQTAMYTGLWFHW